MTSSTDLDLELEHRARVLDAWVAKRRQIAVLEAEAAELLIAQIGIHDADVAEHPHHRDAIYRSMIAEFSAAGRLPQGSMEFAFGDAHALASSLPAVRAAFGEGRLTAAHIREIVRASSPVAEAITNKRADAEIMELYEAAVLAFAEHDTAARTRPHAHQVAAALAGDTVVQRLDRAAGERCVTVRSLDDGLALLTAVLPEWIARAIHDRLTRMSQQIVRTRDHRDPVLDPAVLDAGADAVWADDLAPDDALRDDHAIFSTAGDTFTLDPDGEVERLAADTRGIDQLRADVLSDLLLAADPSAVLGDGLDAIDARIQVTVSATTLAGLDDRPAELDGHGPLHPDVARALAGRSAGWARLFTDRSGLITTADAYTPTAAMKRFLRARDQRCRFPGCRMPVHRCQIDHNHDHAKGGRTSLDNLAHLCTGHHVLKHPDVPEDHRWTAQQLPDGSVSWFSPRGRSYRDHAPRRVMFV
ncbi:HNH endonuclease signature motif containing protein [Streptomyces sp. AC495_CC817]|uniref:HNH endonuclease signature motif containing protein n=1 Tax=Streptomyces sp. AC495_CC817 TaxID=2823900 RepID=UPI001C262E79|nr:HNH endonuclease signature motif containing protein [Streptomyces sp. AC495_CC817]